MMPPSLCRLTIAVIRPSPSIRLNTGPAMHPVTAISPKPYLAMVEEQNASPTELPQERIVSPSRAADMPVSIANSSSMSTMMLASMYTHTIPIRKAPSWKTT